MKILLLCKKFPYPLKDGESIAVQSLSKALTDLGCEVSLLAMNTSKHYYELKEIPKDLSHYRRIKTVDVDNRIKVWDAARNLLSSDSYHVSRYVSKAYARALEQMLAEDDYNVVQLETLYLTPYLPIIRRSGKDIAVCMRAHNVEHEIWERMVQNRRQGPYRWYMHYLTRKLRQYEVQHLNAYDWLAPITLRDAECFKRLGCHIPSLVTPIGLASHRYKPNYDSHSNPLSISFIGSLDWLPNLEGLDWFLDKVWLKAKKQFPDLSFHVAGRNTPESLFCTKKPGVVIHGEVPSARKFINEHSVMVVPLLSGSGMRAKILEGMALGKVVITTSIGLEGIHARHKQEVLVADSPEEFLWALDYCQKKPGRTERIGRRAQEFVDQHFDSIAVAERLLYTYQQTQKELVSET